MNNKEFELGKFVGWDHRTWAIWVGIPWWRLSTGNNNHTSWGKRIIGGRLPGMVDYILHALNGRLNARWEPFFFLWGVKIESANTVFSDFIVLYT